MGAIKSIYFKTQKNKWTIKSKHFRYITKINIIDQSKNITIMKLWKDSPPSSLKEETPDFH